MVSYYATTREYLTQHKQAGIHPFTNAMDAYLTECGLRSKRPAVMSYLMYSKNRRWQESIAFMTDFAQGSKQDTCRILNRMTDPLAH